VTSLLIQGHSKLGPKFFRPFKVLERIGCVTYKLELPPTAHLHNVFHIGLLKPFKVELPMGPGVLPRVKHGCACPHLAEVIKGRLTCDVQELLVRWEGQCAADATWVELEAFRREFPAFKLEDEFIVEGGRDIMTGLKYT
jgi:hypothetical protein